MHSIYDLGYQAIGFDLTVATTERLNAILVDVRLTGYSPRELYRPPSWAKKFEARYVHIPDLGNLSPPSVGPTRIKDLAAGFERLKAFYQVAPLILMCTCKSRHPTCHRKALAYEIHQRWGVTVTELSSSDCTALVRNVRQLA